MFSNALVVPSGGLVPFQSTEVSYSPLLSHAARTALLDSILQSLSALNPNVSHTSASVEKILHSILTLAPLREGVSFRHVSWSSELYSLHEIDRIAYSLAKMQAPHVVISSDKSYFSYLELLPGVTALREVVSGFNDVLRGAARYTGEEPQQVRNMTASQTPETNAILVGGEFLKQNYNREVRSPKGLMDSTQHTRYELDSVPKKTGNRKKLPKRGILEKIFRRAIQYLVQLIKH